MLPILPFALFLLVIAATLLRGRSVRTDTGINAFAFLEARGLQRVAGLAFALSIALLVAATALAAGGRLATSPATLMPGTVIMATGALFVLVAQIQMGGAWRVGVRDGDAPIFVTRGLFRYSRNPIFLGMIAMAVGAALAVATWWAWIAAAAFALACHMQVRIEEAHLAHAFGTDYRRFCGQVPRWLFF